MLALRVHHRLRDSTAELVQKASGQILSATSEIISLRVAIISSLKKNSIVLENVVGVS